MTTQACCNDPSGQLETVTIPHTEYLVLKRERARLEECATKGLLDRSNEFGLFTHDPEVALFLAVRYGIMSESEAIRSICVRFGMDRQPTASQVKRFWLRFQQVLSLD